MDMLPEIGKTYYCFDDGKITYSRRYKVVVGQVIPFEEASQHMKNLWQQQITELDFLELFAKETDFFIVGICYEKSYPTLSLFVRTVDGGWFGLGELTENDKGEEYFDWWGSGRLDVDGHLNASLEKEGFPLQTTDSLKEK